MKPVRLLNSSLFRVLVLAAATLLLVGACDDSTESISIGARISDFLNDLENEDYGRLSRHFHSEVQTQVGTAGEWEGVFRANQNPSYTWNESSRSERNDFGGTTRVRGRLMISYDGDTDSPEIDFFMKTEDGNWMIRAIDDDPSTDGVLIESIRPLFEP